MKYCSNCVLPDSRPNLVINADGVCNACKNALVKKADIDWPQREKAFRSLIENVKVRGAEYDCLIPVSGGKDSTWQVVTCLKYGLKPLAVTIRVLGRNDIGQKNLDNLVRLGVDHIDYQINPSVEKRFMLGSLKKFGATGIPMHMAMHAIPPKIALRFFIPLIVWGENSAFEYGTTNEALTGFSIDAQWLKQYGNTQGTQALDWVGVEGLTVRDLQAYQMMSSKDLEASSTKAIFLGYYFPWDVETSLKVSLAHGFTIRKEVS